MTNRKMKIIALATLIVLVSAALLLAFGKPLYNLLSDPERIRAWVEGTGAWSKLAFVGMMMLQIIVAILPGEPLEICAGYAFGALEGTLLCLAGAVLGTLVVFLFTKRYGLRLARRFFPVEKLDSVSFLQNSQRLHVLTFLLFFIPGSPKDVLTYGLGITSMRLSSCLMITGVARIPSVITSTIGGDALGTSNIGFAAIVFAATAVISLAGLYAYNRYSRHKAAKLDT